VLIDSQLIFYCALSLCVAQRWWSRLNRDYNAREEWAATLGEDVAVRGSIDALRVKGVAAALEAEPPPVVAGAAGAAGAAVARAPALVGAMLGEAERNLWAVALGVACSCAISIKWTGLATPGLIAVESFFGFFFLRSRPAYFADLLKVLTVAVSLYTLWFAVHFALLPNSGDGDAFMRTEFQATLKNSTHYNPAADHPGFFPTFLQLNQEMLAANARIELRHNWESVWWEWPGNLRGLLYYSKDLVQHGIAHSKLIYLLGNPGVIWIVGACIACCFAASACYLRYKHDKHFMLVAFAPFFSAIGYCLWVYVLNLLPYILVNRSAFIYHYMPALMYGEIMSALMIEQLVSKRRMPTAMQLLCVVIIACFLFYAPWVYSTPLTVEGHARRRWLKRWD
jgi:dolichyl-phosphate-mannose--protein O-mannosyl transferase